MRQRTVGAIGISGLLMMTAACGGSGSPGSGGSTAGTTSASTGTTSTSSTTSSSGGAGSCTETVTGAVTANDVPCTVSSGGGFGFSLSTVQNPPGFGGNASGCGGHKLTVKTYTDADADVTTMFTAQDASTHQWKEASTPNGCAGMGGEMGSFTLDLTSVEPPHGTYDGVLKEWVGTGLGDIKVHVVF
jgi:hypothetical protein